jgi:hypothetical protein
MLPPSPHRLCKLPKTARLAQLVLASPIVPIEYAVDASKQAFSFDAKPYHITGNGQPIPAKIDRDLQTNVSHSVADWLLAASRDPKLDEIDQKLFADLRDRMVEVAAAGMNDQPIDASMQGRLMTACSNVSRKQTVPDWKGVQILGVEAPKAFEALQKLSTEISNKLLIEEQQSRGGHAHG